jgi:hypothetical protein
MPTMLKPAATLGVSAATGTGALSGFLGFGDLLTDLLVATGLPFAFRQFVTGVILL